MTEEMEVVDDGTLRLMQMAERAFAERDRLLGFVDFVNLWVTRDNATDEERISVIKHHPTASDRRAALSAARQPEVKP